MEMQRNLDDLLNLPDDEMLVAFWGIRGTLPVPGKKTMRYGGNTNCVTLSIGQKEFFIFDAGTGIKELSNYLIQNNALPIKAKIFISHHHYDHINGIPFFVPLYMKDNEFDIYGKAYKNLSNEQLLASQMDSIHFPVTMHEFSAKLNFHDLTEENFTLEDIHIKTILLNHPGGCLGYRVDYQGKSFCYITDNEIYLEDDKRFKSAEVDKLVQFIAHTDVLVMDTTYFDEDYIKKAGWGHACLTRAVEVADLAQVKLLCLYHHDPDHFDKDIDLKLKLARTILKKQNSKTVCIAPREGDAFKIE